MRARIPPRRALTVLLGVLFLVLRGSVQAGPVPPVRDDEAGFTPLVLPKAPPSRPQTGTTPTVSPVGPSTAPAPTPVVQAPPRLGRWTVDASAVWDRTGQTAPWGSLNLREERGSHSYWLTATSATGNPVVSAGANTGVLIGTLGRLTPDHLPISLAAQDLSGIDLRLTNSGWRYLDGTRPDSTSRVTNLSLPLAVAPRFSLWSGVTLVAQAGESRRVLPTLEAAADVGDGTSVRGEVDLVPGTGEGNPNYSLGIVQRRPRLVLNAGFVRLTAPADPAGFLRQPGDSWFAAATHSLPDGHTWVGARAGGTKAKDAVERRFDLSLGRSLPSLTTAAALSLTAGSSGAPALETSLSLTWPLPLPLTLTASLVPQGPEAGLNASVAVARENFFGLGRGSVRFGYGDGPVGDGWWIAGTLGEGEVDWQGRLSAGYYQETPLLSPLGELTGRVFLDANLNGRWDQGEAALPGLRAILSGGKTAQTGPDGRYRFIRVPYGPWQVSLDPATVPARYLIPTSAVRITLARRVATVDLPLAPAVVVRGRVILAEAATGPDLAALARALADLPVTVGTTTVLTAADGSFTLSVVPGDYSAAVSAEALASRRLSPAGPPVGFRATTDGEAFVALPVRLARPPLALSDF